MSTTPLPEPDGAPLIAASILGADFGHLERECRASIEAGADLLHLDVMDGHFVPNLTMGPALCDAVSRAVPGVCLDVHLMVTEPGMFIAPFRDAGADHITFHAETVRDPVAFVDSVHAAGMTAGIAYSPPTPVDPDAAVLDVVELALVMSVHPGFAGQAFIPEVLPKGATLRDRLRPDQRLQIDGGVNASTAGACRTAGFDVLVAASAIYGSRAYDEAIRELRGSL